MKNPNQYGGKNPIPGPTRYGNNKGEGAKPAAVVAPGVVPVTGPTGTEAAAAAVAITSIGAKAPAANDPNVNVVAKATTDATPDCAADAPVADAKPLASAEAKVDALADVKSGAQILADTSKPAAATLPKS
jgi:hypothetical protein